MYTLKLKQADDTIRESHSNIDIKVSHLTKYKCKPWSSKHASLETKRLTHIYTKNDNQEKKSTILHGNRGNKW